MTTQQKDPNGPVRLGQILRDLIEKKTGRKLPVNNVKVWEVWDKAVGAQIARVARPQQFQGGRLFVGTLHDTWVTELSYRREEIREKVNAALGYEGVKEVVFRLARKL